MLHAHKTGQTLLQLIDFRPHNIASMGQDPIHPFPDGGFQKLELRGQIDKGHYIGSH
jgi:hypothetical protein